MVDSGVLKGITDSGNKLTVKSALNPVLWLCAIAFVAGLSCLGLAVSVYATGFPVWALCTTVLTLTVSPIIIVGFGFVYLLLVDRDKLQSEGYQLKKQQIEISQQKGERRPNKISGNDENAEEDLENE